MKKILSILMITVMLAATAVADSGKAVMTFNNKSYDLGTIKADGGPVTAVYEFTNTGNAPLAILTVTNGGCGCTTPDYPKAPIKPGAKGVIKIHFNPRGRKGEVNRSVRVKSNAKNSKIELQFSAVVVP